jgi:uridine kinase
VPAGLDGHRDPIVTDARSAVLGLVAAAVLAPADRRRVLVGIDGASGTGKSTFADELAGRLEDEGRVVLRSTIDSFHRPRAERYRLGATSPEGYYRDSHDLDVVRRELLDPFRAGDGDVVVAAFDEPSDAEQRVVRRGVPGTAVLVFDGLFLHRPELAGGWDVSVFLVADARRERAWQEYLHADLPARAEERDAEIAARIGRARRARYVEGQRLYEEESRPWAGADFVIDNDDLSRPVVLPVDGPR